MVNPSEALLNYGAINSDMPLPPKAATCCGRDYTCIKDKGHMITRLAIVIFMGLAAGLASYLNYNPNEDPIEERNPLFPFALSAVGAIFLGSFISEAIFCGRISTLPKKWVPSPCTVAFIGIGMATTAVFYDQHQAAIVTKTFSDKLATAHTEITDLSYACRDTVFAKPEYFTNEKCTLCESLDNSWDSTSVRTDTVIVYQQYLTFTKFDICFYKNGTPKGIEMAWVKDINASAICHEDPITTTTLEERSVLNYIKQQEGFVEPISLKVSIVNRSNANTSLIGCKQLKGNATRSYPISRRCNFTHVPLPAWQLDMHCETNYSVAYFNVINEIFLQINNSIPKRPERAFEILESDLMPKWMSASLFSAIGAGAYKTGRYCLTEFIKSRKKEFSPS